jgi:two-component system, cell cycle sensor histidine kinase and response regulator CckA
MSDVAPVIAEPLPTGDRGELLDMIEEVMGLGLYVWEPGRRVRWSRGMYRLLGLDPSRPVPAAHYYEHVHPDDRARVVMASTTVLTRGMVEEFRYRLRRPDGTVDWVAGAGWVERDGEDGPVARVVGTIVRVTDVQRADDNLAQVNALLADTQRAAGIGSYVYNLTSGTLEYSDELYRLLGIEPGTRVDGMAAHRLVHVEDAVRQLEWGTRIAAGELLPPLLARIVRPADGRTVYLESIARRVERAEGPCVVGVSLDVTARVALEEELRHAARTEAVGALAAGIAHDFNNYLAVLAAQLDLSRLQGGTLRPTDHETMMGALERCAGLVRQLLAFARKHPYHPEPLDLATQVKAVAALFERVSGAAVRTVLMIADRPVVHGDSTQLDGALMNLLVNARDAMPGGGTIEVALAEVTRDRGELPAGRYARLAVTDTGTGIEPEHLPYVFEPYFTTKANDRGTGLGLAAVLGTVRQHGGEVNIASEVGTGTTVEVLLPIADPTGDGRVVVRPEPAPVAAMTLLLVEDLEIVRVALASLLEMEGHVVTTAHDGRAALDLVESGAVFDLVLSDVEMPRMDGVSLARALIARTPAVPILLMTGYADHAAAAGVAVTLNKPFSRDELIAAMARVRAG